MQRFEAMRDSLRHDPTRFTHLDAAQLVKHAFGLVTDGQRKGKTAWLVYLFAEPSSLGTSATFDGFSRHREEIATFAAAIQGDDVRFLAISYRDWLKTWPHNPAELAKHAELILSQFTP